MRLLQTYYTSCRIGQSGASGFQFYSFSEGLTKDELFEIEKIGNYIAPLHLPSNPSMEDIETLFPTTFSYFKLKSGRVGVLQSVALIQDYSGRPGNFLSHAFVIESGNFPFLPILLYKSISFRANLNTDEWNTETIPLKLPTIEIETLVKNSTIGLSSIRDFLSKNDNEILFSQIINSIIENSVNNRKILLCDDQINISFWISSISFAFPLNLALNLTFSTYTFDPANNSSLICATTKDGNRFNFTNETAYQFQYYIFNVLLNKHSAANQSYTYAEVASIGLAISYDNFITLQQYFNNFNYHTTNSKIDLIYKIFSAEQGIFQFHSEWADLLGFVNQFAKDFFLEKYLSSNNAYLELVLSHIITDNAATSNYFEQIVSILKKTKSLNDFKINFNLYLSWLNMVVFSPDGETLSQGYVQQILLTNEDIVKQFLLFGDYFETNFFSNDNFKDLQNYLSDTEISSFFTYLISVIFQNAQLCNYSVENVFKIDAFSLIISKYLKNIDLNNDLEILFSSFSNIKSYSIILNKFSSHLSSDILLSIAQKTDTRIIQPETIFLLVKESDNAKLYIALMPYFLTYVTNKSSCFWDSIEFADLKHLGADQYEYLINSYIDICSPLKTEIQKIILLLAEKGFSKLLPKLIEKYESTLDLDDLANEDFRLILEVGKVKKKFNITTKHSLCEFYSLMVELHDKKILSVLTAIKKVNSNFNELQPEKFRRLLSNFFHYLLPLISKEKDFYYLFIFIFKLKQNIAFDLFQNVLLNRFDTSQEKSILISFMEFNFEIDQYDSEISAYSKLEIEKLMFRVLFNLNNSKLNTLEDLLLKKKITYKKKWEIILVKMRTQQNTNINNKIKNAFRTIFKK